jgi:hypothetical protein
MEVWKMTSETSGISNGQKASSIIAMLSGLWLFISPWVFNADTRGTAFDGWIVGALMVILAAFELATPSIMGLLSWVNCLLAIWIFASPWMFGFTSGSGRFIDYLCVGVIVFFVSIGNALSPAHPSQPMQMGH